MEIERKGGNCVVISFKKDAFVIDPKLSHLGLKDYKPNATAVILTHQTFGVQTGEELLVIDGPGEYEVRNCSIKGVAAAAYKDTNDQRKDATVYRLDIDGCAVAVMGHIKPRLSDEELESIGVIDMMIVPVGGFGYTLDPKEAVDLVRAIEPKIIIPTHYAEEGVNYEVPQAPLEDFLKELGARHETTPKLKIKAAVLPDALTVYEITRTK